MHFYWIAVNKKINARLLALFFRLITKAHSLSIACLVFLLDQASLVSLAILNTT